MIYLDMGKLGNFRENYVEVPPASGRLLEQCIFDPQIGYDLGAEFYDDWKWQKIWREVEWPRLDELLSEIDFSSGGLSSILDVGVGTGSYLQHVVEKFDIRKRFGIDVSRRMLALAKLKLQNRAVLSLGDATNLEFSDGCFDVVLLCRVGSHLKDIHRAASEIRRVLRPGGFLILSDLDSRHSYQLTRIPYGKKKISIRTCKHSNDEWTGIAEQLGFRVQINHTIWSEEIRRSSVSDLPSSLAPSRPVSFILSAQKYFY